MSEKIIYDDLDGKSHDVTDLIHALGYVRVVRCKDCKCWDSDCRWCDLWGDTQEYDDGYCSYGERKEHE